jgi:uncharacterized membrane protein YeaQ/YmgE (transglycosylase-associated protein family)
VLATIGYLLAYALIGLVAALISRRFMPGRVPATSAELIIWGIVGAFVGGLGALALLKYGFAQSQAHGTGGDYAAVKDGSASEPGYWMSALASALGALVALAAYKLLKGKRSEL